MQPTHPRTGWAANIIRGVQSFSELESRIAALSLEKDRGDAFEVFVEAFLATQPIAQVKTIWAANSAPISIRRKLNLPSSDFGADGIYRDRSDSLVVYQVKFRTGRTSLSWRDLATFFGIAEKADQRVLLTNSDTIAEVAEKRTKFHCFRGSDFERLEASDFELIAEWLASGAIKPIKRKPRPHQLEALSNIEAGLKDNDRATIVMACGSGKTLIALWAAEQVSPKRVLVLVPSLALLRQTLHEWSHFTRWGDQFRFLCVCSDPTVSRGIDQLIVRQEDTDFPVSTDKSEVTRFLGQKAGGVQVVFSTYQSAQVVSDGMKKADIFDIGIFDEAHKTAGREGSKFSFALSDENLPIKKRLFFTATPRHYSIQSKDRDREGDAKLVFSMDNEEVYGPIVHKLTFADAAKRDIICNYKIVISVVDGKMVNNDLLKRGEVLVKDDYVRARQVAVQLALQRAVQEFGVGRIITFHNSVEAAARFVAETAEGVQNHLPHFSTFHVNGKQRTADREDFLRGFAEANKGLITNARCLTEGIDVPAVDMVAFVAPRRSKIDIVQATGRAMRKAGPEKDCGYILLPLFLEKTEGETLEDALERSKFEEVADVLNAMQEQDEELTEIIRQLQMEKGRVGGFDESRLADKLVTIGPQIGLAELRKAVSARLIDTLGVSWDERYGELVTYRDRFGDCNVPATWPENPKLGSWVTVQRSVRKANKMDQDRIRRLDELGFVWDMLDAAWEEMFSALVGYRNNFGDCNVPQAWPENSKLGTWVTAQRSRRNRLKEDQVRRLDELSFDWNPLDTTWEEMFSALVGYRDEFGDCLVPAQWPENPELGGWVMRQRTQYLTNRLGKDRIRRLDELGFSWDAREAAWEEMFAALAAYKGEHGNCDVPALWPKNPKLGPWISVQRSFRKKNKLDKDRIRRLDELGFVWDVLDAAWEELFEALVVYRDKFGHCDVPLSWSENSKLATWVSNRRKDRKINKLDKDSIRRLDELGFIWNTLDAAWEKMFGALVDYRDRFGDCKVPKGWPENPKLATWVSGQRSIRNKKKLTKDRILRLDELGFIWDAREARWEEMFEALAAYWHRFGDCNVPRYWPENQKLSNWVGMQRNFRKASKVNKDRIRRLDELGFIWNMLDAAWETMFAALVDYRDRFGHCDVPQSWPENPKLGSWVTVQRRVRKTNRLAQDRIHRLDELGFDWTPSRKRLKVHS